MKKFGAGFYCWGGPGTIRLLQTKYFAPTIDEESFMRVYEPAYLDVAKKIFGLTDMFVSYSWGFSDQTEKIDRAFISSRLKNFSNRSITTYAYIQGFNLVYDDFKEKDLWCKSPYGRTLMYSKGRGFTCPCNPETVEIIQRRIESALREGFDNIFVDNVLFGLPPLFIYDNETSFFGCSCRHCQKAFKSMGGYTLPLGKKSGSGIIADYLMFRREIIKQTIARFSNTVRSAGKGFGINLYDPLWRTAPYYYGFDVSDIEPCLDYFLFENHSLMPETINNTYLRDLIKTKNTFIVSYRNNIGHEPAFTQRDMNLIYSESRTIGYIPCYKATEYTTNGIWHALKPENYETPKRILIPASTIAGESPLNTLSPPGSMAMSLLNQGYMCIAPEVPENRLLSSLFVSSKLFSHALRKRRYWR